MSDEHRPATTERVVPITDEQRAAVLVVLERHEALGLVEALLGTDEE